MYEEAWNDLQIRGYQAATVIRLTPWPQTLDGVAHQLKHIPGVPTDAEVWRTQVPRLILKNGLSVPFVRHMITDPYISVGTRFRGRSENDSTAETRASIDLPITLGRDIVQQQNLLVSQGGIFCYEGSDLLLTPKDQEGRKAYLNQNEVAPLADAVQMAFDRMLTHMNALISQAETAYMSDDKNLKREVRGNRFRLAVQYMLNAGQISQPPEWFTERSEGSQQRSQTCPMCQARVKVGSAKCTCNYILDPFKAYGKLYTEEDAGGLLTARRMTKLQLKELGLYPRIKPHDEWLADQNLEAATKPDKKKGE